MPTFQYRAIQSDGTIAEGQLEAAGRPDAFRQMEGRGLRPVSLAERAAKSGASKNGSPAKSGSAPAEEGFSLKFRPTKVSAKELENFTRLLSSLLAAGVPLSRALVILCKEASNPVSAAKWREVHDLVIDGMSLADAMAKSPETFPRVYTAMVEAGEAGGFLDVVLAQIAEFQAREKDLKAKVMTAMLYPSGDFDTSVLAIVVLIVLLTFFIPEISKRVREHSRDVAADYAGDYRGEPCATVVRFVCGRGSAGTGPAGAELVRVGKGQARLGDVFVARTDCRSAHGEVCHGAILPDARHAAGRGACR